MCRAANTILHYGLHLSSLAVGDGYGIFSEANGCYVGWLGLNHGGGDLLLLLRRRRALGGRQMEESREGAMNVLLASCPLSVEKLQCSLL